MTGIENKETVTFEFGMNDTEVVEILLKQSVWGLKGNVVGLIGTVGAGKTHLVKKLLKTLDPTFENQVQSPTFNICNVYNSTGLDVHHFDLYRVESDESLYDIEIWESIDNHKILIFIEWVDQFPELLEKCDTLVTISIDLNGQRKYELKKN